jgi:hypothetical protein
VAHVELSLSEPNLTGPRPGRDHLGDGTLGRWAGAVAVASESCLLLDFEGAIVAVSTSCLRLFRAGPAISSGYRFIDVVRLLDFTAAPCALPEWELDKIPPLLALSSGGLARGLLRVPNLDGSTCTLDAVASPLRDRDTVVGSLTFFATVNH